MIDTLVKYAWTFIGQPYIWGAQHPSKGFDCSGLVCEILKAGGIIKNHDDFTANSLYDHLISRGFRTHNSNDPGTICFYGTDLKKTHVTFAIGNDLMIEAGGGGHLCLDLKTAIFHQAFVRIRPINSRPDLTSRIFPKN